MEKLLILDETVNFYSKPDVKDTKKKRVEKNEEFTILKIEKVKDEYWIKVISENNLEAYTNELNKIAIELPVKFSKQKKLIVYSEPNSISDHITVLDKKEVFYVLHKTHDILDQTIIWKKIKLEDGIFGYINTDIDFIPINRAEKKRKMNCVIATLIIVSLLFIISVISYYTGNNHGVPVITLVITYFVFYTLFIVISGFFKSKMEKYYYPNLLTVFNYKII